MKTTQEMIAVMQHYVDGGKVEVTILGANQGWAKTDSPCWDWNNYDYRIAKPEPKKVNMLCWFDGYALRWYGESNAVASDWKRVPSEDKIIEVEE